MKFIDIFRISFGNLKRNRLRTVLTMSGVVIGIGTITLLVSLGFGLKKLALEKIVKLEALKIISVMPSGDKAKLDDEVVDSFRKIDNVESVSPVKRSVATIDTNGNKSDQVLYGVDSRYIPLENITITKGVPFESNDAHEALMSEDIISSLDLKEDELFNKGLALEVDGEKADYRIVGTFSEKGIYVPYDIIKTGDGEYASIKIKTPDKIFVPQIKKTVESMGFNTSVIKDQSDAINKIFLVINIVLGGFGLVAFFVAAIGIFNTMTISILERTHEIGIMKAIGGDSKSVAFIFITEAALIGLMGGAIGLLSGWLISLGINAIINYLAESVGGTKTALFDMTFGFCFQVMIFSLLVSTFAGVWPARRAARLNPLDALRYE